MYKNWDIFCKVVDNFGDAGISLRLARCLRNFEGGNVRLWIDDFSTLACLCPALSGMHARIREGVVIDGVEVRLWTVPLPQVSLSNVVIEAFGCALPDTFIAAMADRKPAPVWINLEYLSAETWVERCHGLKSAHPALLLTKYFFFPGFSEGTGGLLREPDIRQKQARFNRQEWLSGQGVAVPDKETVLISLFSYEQPDLPALAKVWAQGSLPVHVLVPEGRILNDLAMLSGQTALKAGMSFSQGALTVSILPFSDQDTYDRLLWSCDINFVRGEDSFIRAQWAEKPFVWHIYPQDEGAHYSKLEAFITLYTAHLPANTAAALKQFWYAWNGKGDIAASWPAFVQALPVLRRQARDWSESLARQDDLATRLNQFCSHIMQLESKIQAL